MASILENIVTVDASVSPLLLSTSTGFFIRLGLGVWLLLAVEDAEVVAEAVLLAVAEPLAPAVRLLVPVSVTEALSVLEAVGVGDLLPLLVGEAVIENERLREVIALVVTVREAETERDCVDVMDCVEVWVLLLVLLAVKVSREVEVSVGNGDQLRELLLEFVLSFTVLAGAADADIVPLAVLVVLSDALHEAVPLAVPERVLSCELLPVAVPVWLASEVPGDE